MLTKLDQVVLNNNIDYQNRVLHIENHLKFLITRIVTFTSLYYDSSRKNDSFEAKRNNLEINLKIIFYLPEKESF